MDPLSVSASIATLVQLTSGAMTFLSDMKNASSERTKLRSEVLIVSGMLKMLENRLKYTAADDEWFTAIQALAVRDGAFDQLKQSLDQLTAKTGYEKTSGIPQPGRNVAWHVGKNELNKTLMNVGRLISLINLALANDLGISIQKIKVDSAVLTRDVSEIKDDFKGQKIDKECQEIGDWLSPFDFKAMQQEILDRCHAGTGTWMLGSHKFQQWSNSQNETLWCPGIPGGGKTYLASIVIDYLRQQTSSEGQNAVLCLFCSFNERANQTACNFMGALLKQLPQATRNLSSGIRSIYDRRENARRPNFRELADAFRIELKKFSKTFIVIDALDEVLESVDIRTILLTELRSCPVNLLVTSRHDPTIERQFSEAQRCEIRAADEDIRSYISERIGQENRLSRQIHSVPSLRDDILARIVGSAKGMFLLARFHMDEVSNKTKPKQIEKALEELPQGLNDNYDRTIDRIKSQGSDCWDLARKVLLWLSNAVEPLSIAALQEAVAVESGMTSIGIRDLDDSESLISACAGLVVFEGGKETSAPRLVHYTLQEYLNQNQATLSPNPHAVIARACLAFLSFDDFNKKPPDSSLRQPRIYRIPLTEAVPYIPYQFTCYAAMAWGFHTRRAGETEVMDAALDFLSRPVNVAYNWHVMMLKCHPAPSKGLEPATYEELLKDADFFKLSLALRFQCRGILVELLKRRTRSAENALGLEISRLACDPMAGQDKEIVRLLLTINDVDLGAYGDNDKNLLKEAAYWNDKETVRTLLQKESCSINALTDSGSALHWAAMRENTSIARMLLEAGADVEARGKHCMAVLPEVSPHLLGSAVWKEMMELLLEYKADINAFGLNGDTALHAAASFSHFDTCAVEYLVSKGANLNLTNDRGKTPLDLAEGQSTDRREYYKDIAAKIIQILREAGGKNGSELS